MSRFSFLKQLVLALAVTAIVSLASATAKADIVVVTGVNNQGTDNVLLNPATNVLTVTGTVGANNLLVNFIDRNPNGSELFLVGQCFPIVSLNCCHLLTVSKHAAQSRLHFARRSQC